MTAKHSRQGESRTNGKARSKAASAIKLTLAVGTLLLTGCAGSGSDWSFKNNRQGNPASHIGLKDWNQSKVSTREYVQGEARQYRMPDQYLSEARVGLAEIEAALAAAKASEVEHEAVMRERLSFISAHRQSATAREKSRLAEAEKVQDQYASKQSELWTTIAARERNLNSSVEEHQAQIEAYRKEREMAHAGMVSRAWQEYTKAQAQVEEMQAIRRATASDGEATLAEMRETLKATQSRGSATVQRLRSDAEAVRKQSLALAEELHAQIGSIRTQSQSQSAELRSRAESLEKQAEAKFNELTARADTLTEQASKEYYDLKVKQAETELANARSEGERLRTQANTTLDRADAEIARLLADAERVAFLAETNYTNGMAELDSWYSDKLAENSKQFTRADRLEAEARAEFVKAEAAARANAARETALHQRELADAEMNKIIAEAEHEAARVRSQILDELAKRQQQGSVERSGKTGEPTPLPENLHDVPHTPQVKPVTPQIEPEHIAQFRSSLARVMNVRATAEAEKLALTATFEESQQRVAALRTQFMAISSEMLAVAEAMSTQARAQFDALITQADSVASLAQAEYEKSLVEADSFRKDALAQATDLRAEATAQRELALSHAALARTESDVVLKNGESEAQALEATLDATRRRGTAEFNRLMVEADSIEKSNQALVMRLNAQIASGEQILETELAKQARTIESAISIAEANYREANVNADVFARKTDVEVERLTARNTHAQTLASAEIEHLRNLSHSTVLQADATVGRMVARARAEREQSEAVAQVAAAKVRTDADFARAEVMAQTRIAQAHEGAVRAQFDARLAQVQADRVREATDAYRDDFFKRTNLEISLAQAEAIRSEMNERFAALKNEQQQLQRAARENWDSRLASMQQRRPVPTPRPSLSLPEELENVQFTNVPTDRD
jgi:hypothetical protein